MHYNKTDTPRGNKTGLDQNEYPINFLADSFGDSTSNIDHLISMHLSFIQHKNSKPLPPPHTFVTNLSKYDLN